MDFKETFLNLTEYTLPYGYENRLEKYLPKGFIKDVAGNYYIKIGKKSRTIFTCHMDTASGDVRKVKHVIFYNYIKSDGSTILGGDDKNGMTVMLYMIEQKIPGTYYFFVGEESGMVGAHEIIQKNRSFFKNYDRMVSIDRRGYNSVITSQMGQVCCSKEFGQSLANELNKNGMEYRLDPTGIYTDSASFMGIIPNVTNLSCGYFDEHSHKETTDIDFVEKLAKACCKVNWNALSQEPAPTRISYGYSGRDNGWSSVDQEGWWM